MSKVYDATELLRMKQCIAMLERCLAEHERPRPDKPTRPGATIIKLAAARGANRVTRERRRHRSR